MSILEGTILRVVASLVFPDDVIMQNVFHIVLTNIVGSGDEDDVTTDLEEYAQLIYDELEGSMSDQMAGSEIKCYEYDSIDDDWDEIGTGALVIVGGGSADFMPHGTALLQLFYTLDPDVQGRKFWGGLTESSHADGDWTAGVIASAVLAAAEIVGTFVGTGTGNSYQPGVWSPTNGLMVVYSGVVATPAVVAYQRRRKPGVGI